MSAPGGFACAAAMTGAAITGAAMTGAAMTGAARPAVSTIVLTEPSVTG